jgi:hypothetical protein
VKRSLQRKLLRQRAEEILTPSRPLTITDSGKSTHPMERLRLSIRWTTPALLSLSQVMAQTGPRGQRICLEHTSGAVEVTPEGFA